MSFISPVEIDIIVKILFAAFLGALIGFEREIHDKPAGLRTLSIVAVGSALFTLVSQGFNGVADPSRIAAGIVTGIGFLGAGTIFRADNKVHGITTAAELWVVAALGIAVALGMFAVAFTTTVIVLAITIGGKLFERRAEKTLIRYRRKYGGY